MFEDVLGLLSILVVKFLELLPPGCAVYADDGRAEAIELLGVWREACGYAKAFW